MLSTLSFAGRAALQTLPPLRMVLLLALLCGSGSFLGGCVSTGGEGPVANAQASMGSATVAFDSVDGPPPQVFDGFVTVLDNETKLRGINTVSREDPGAAYRIRSYLAAIVRSGRTHIAWVWDVYDREQQRSLRLSGEEPAGKSGKDNWATADAAVLKRIAEAGLTGLSQMVNGTLPDPEPAPLPAIENTRENTRAVASSTIMQPTQTAAVMDSNARMRP